MKTEENKVETPAQEAAPATPAQEATQAPDLTINDLNTLRAIVDIASQRGAFKAPELEVVGKTFNKLNAFLEAAAKSGQQPTEGQ